MHARQGFADVNGTRIGYEVAGSGQPLVLIHGFSLDRRMWDDQFASFADRYQVIRYDARGFGQSAVPTGEPYAPTDDLKALLEHLGIAQATLIGLSMGGGIALDFALAHPAATRALVLVDTTLGGYQWPPEWDATVIPIWQGARQGGVEVARARWLAHPLFAPALEKPGVAARLTRIVTDYSGWHWVNSDPGRGIEPAAAQRLGEIDVPTLVLVGERDLPDFHAIAALVERQVAQARTAVVPGAGHMASMEAPASVTAAIERFLAARA